MKSTTKKFITPPNIEIGEHSTILNNISVVRKSKNSEDK